MNRASGQKINKATEILNDTIQQLDLIFLGQYMQKKKKRKKRKTQNIHSFQVHMEHSLGLTMYWVTKLTSTTLRV